MRCGFLCLMGRHGACRLAPGMATPQIRQLCFGGDWACAHGDLSALRFVALQLAADTSDPLHCGLIELADACRYDPDLAPLMWSTLKPSLTGT
jgi:hypothetical protein